jgi:hypothetical protein
MKFPNMESLAEVEFLAGPPRLVTDEDRHRHCQVHWLLLIAEWDKRFVET